MKSRNNIQLGMLPPQDIEAEKVVLGALMIESDAYERVSAMLTPSAFYKEDHVLIYKAIEALFVDHKPIDIVTVTAQLKSEGSLDLVGGAYAITVLTQNVYSSANIEAHASIVAEKYLLREIIRVSGEMQSRAFKDEEDAFELVDEFVKLSTEIQSYGLGEQDKPFHAELEERVEEKHAMVKAGVSHIGVPSGTPKLDSVIGGFVQQNLIILAARPGQGKSVKGMNYCKSVAKRGHPSIFFSLEMSTGELIDRMVVEEAKIPLGDYRSNKLTQYDLQKVDIAAKELRSLPIHIFDRAAIKPSFIRKKIKQVIKQRGSIGLVVVDYLQLMMSDGKSGNREQEVAEVSRELKAIAKEFDVPVIALAQLSRAVEQTTDKRPLLSHLRESGSIEQDADVVMFIYRPSYYFNHGKHPDDIYANMGVNEYLEASELIIAKNRNGIPNARIFEKFVGQYAYFGDPEQRTEDDPFEVQSRMISISSKIEDDPFI